MRILFANDGVADAGGVHTYLKAVMEGLAARGYELGFLHCERTTNKTVSPNLAAIPHFSVEDHGLERVMTEVKLWSPEVCFSHNMRQLTVERSLMDCFAVVKFMHGYFGTCIGGQKSFFFPGPAPCNRRFGKACLSLYFPRRCGQLSLNKMIEGYGWAKGQNELFKCYKAIVVASEHMRLEYVGNGADEAQVFVNPLFSEELLADADSSRPEFVEDNVLFLGRMTKLKGGDLLVRAVWEASRQLGTEIKLTMAGEGPQKASWQNLARRLNISVAFPGWVTGDEQVRLLKKARLLAVPSVWPEPFGLVGLEAADYGVPAIAFDVGGISEWLRHGVNGFLLPNRALTSQALADGLVSALSHPERLIRMGRAARETARVLSLSRHLDQLEDILNGARAGAV
jgi:glycosyltransferase involved in cell wall biosynthesis